MKRSDDPLRLIEDPNAPAPLAEAVRAARGSAPDPARLGEIAAVLGLPAPLPIPPPVGPGAGMAAGAGTAKVVITGLAAVTAISAVAVVGAVGMTVLRRHPPAAPRAVVQKVERRAPELPEPEIPIAEAPPAAPALPSPRHHHPGRAAPAVAVAEDAPAAPADVASRLREEAALVQAAERLLASDPARALGLTEERRRRFPTGALDQEAEVVAIDALLRLGRRPEATARAQAFESAHAGSLHARRVRRLLGGE